METCFNYCDEKRAFFSSDERKWITRVRKLLKEHPDEVKLIASPEENDGCIYVELPAKWLLVQPPRKLNLTDEKREEMRQRMLDMRKHMSES